MNPISMHSILRRFWNDAQAVALVEFALTLPLLITLFYGTVEVTRYILIAQKVEKLAYTMGDAVTRSASLSQIQLDQIFTAADDIMKPYSTGTSSRILIHSINRDASAANATIIWQESGAGSLAATSRIGAQGAVPVLPAGFTIDPRENVIATEAFYQFSPLLTNRWFGETTIYRVTFYKPRFGALLVQPS